MAAGLTDPCWWVEVRARPDALGRRTALELVDRLVLYLGGQVWTSGGADFGLWEDNDHPAVERLLDRALVIAQDRGVVSMSSWITDAIATRSHERIVQVLTPVSATLTPALHAFLAGPMGCWVVRAEDGGHFDGISGLPLVWDDKHGYVPEGLFEGHGGSAVDRRRGRSRAVSRPPHPVDGFLGDVHTETLLHLDLVARHEDASLPKVGRAAELLCNLMAGRSPVLWGPHEPTLAKWDTQLIRRSLLHRGPDPSILHFSGTVWENPRFAGSLRFTWDRFKATERITVTVGFPNEEDLPFTALPEVVALLAEAGLLHGFQARTHRGRADLLHAPRWQGGAVPLGIAVGSERVQRIGAEKAQAGPIKGNLIGRGEGQAIWYPVIGDPSTALRELERQKAYLESADRV